MRIYSKYNHARLLEENQMLICGDSQNILKQIPSESVQSVITSPPYWGLRDYNSDGQIGLENTVDEFIKKLSSIFDEVRRVLKKDGTLWVNIGDCYTSGNRKYRAVDKKNNARGMSIRPDTPIGLKPKDLIGIPWKLAFSLQNCGWFLRSEIIWFKPNSMPESVKDRPHKSHEYLFLFSKSKKYYFNFKALNNVNNFTKSVWEINTKGFNGIHSATFPAELIKPCLETSTREGDVILDPFLGSGTVAEVCKRNQRSCIGIDINIDFINLALNRIASI